LVLSDSNARLVASRHLTDRRHRQAQGLFLAEGVQAVREALRARRASSIFVTEDALARNAELLAGLPVGGIGVGGISVGGVSVDVISAKAAASLSETVNPQGIVAVCRIEQPSALSSSDQLVVVLVDANDPGNAGTILRTADAAGASTVIFAGDSVDPYNGKCVRASAGSLFHVRVIMAGDPLTVLDSCRAAGLACLATSGHGSADLDDLIDHGRLSAPTAWVFGNEARGLPQDVIDAADLAVRVPIYGAAESLNLAAAAAVCLYASARSMH
jgi:TrmH family RNA methyltransferase